MAIVHRTRSLPDRPWEDWVQRIIIHVPDYLSYEGEPTSGGRQRKVREVSRLIREEWGRDCIIVQKANRSWQVADTQGTEVRGVDVRLDVYGDPSFGRKTQAMVGKGDAIVYLGGEDAWPFFVHGAKAFHVGIWWDGPFSSFKKGLTARRTEALFRVCRSAICVDTNVINWLRSRSPKNQASANRAVYLPNSVRLDRIPDVERTRTEGPMRLLFARRFELKRGADLALDSVALLQDWNVDVRIHMSTAQGHEGTEAIRKGAEKRGIGAIVDTYENDLDTVFSLYAEADVALVPTLWSEGTSYSCVEALAAGLPVVTTTVGGLPNLVIPEFNGYVTRPSPEPFAAAIQRLTVQDTWNRMHVAARSMRAALSQERWDREVLAWLRA